MNFELLPNEIILDLFEYFSISHLFHSFLHLNSRFNRLLYIQFQKFHLDLRLSSKTKFNHICQNYVPLIIDRIISLHLSNDDDTPQQIELFLFHPYQLRQFIRLQSISLEYLRSEQTLDQIMIECSYLSCLTHLTFLDGHISMNENDANRFFSCIWSLTNLTHCHFNICFAYENYFPNSTVTSTSLRHLIIQNTSCSLSAFTRLCQHSPNLEHLSINFEDDSDQLKHTLPILSITRLKIRFDDSIDILEHLLQYMPNLYHLTLETHITYINGYQWEKLICKYLPKLEIFQAKMSFSPLNDENKEIQLNEIVNSYRTKFWMNEHQWFVRCHWCTSGEQQQRHRINLFTLPYTFRNFFTHANYILAKSTCPYDDENLTCDRVINLYYGSSDFTSLIDRFSNIQSLSLCLPFDDQFLSVVSKLDRLSSLYVFVDKNKNLDNVESQLQFLLDRIPHLRSLSFGVWLPSSFQVPPMELTSVSVCQLDLQGYTYENDWRCFDDEQCIQLSRSPLGIQCETLLIAVKGRRNVLDLVNSMSNLQALNVRCEDDNWSDENNLLSSIDDELIQWLRQQLPTTYIITRDSYLSLDIRIWIG